MAVADRIRRDDGPDTATDSRQAAAPGQAGIGDEQLIARLHEGCARLKRQVHQVIVGQDGVIDSVLCCMLAGGHCIVQGVPGLAKTPLVHSIADAMKLRFNRIQFTPDLMPSDITGVTSSRGTRSRDRGSSNSSRARSSRTSCWPMRPTERRPYRSARRTHGQNHGPQGLFLGDRLAVFLSSTDLHCGWCDSHGIEWGLDAYRKTIQWGINIIMYAMTH